MRGSRFDDAWYKQQHAFAIRRGYDHTATKRLARLPKNNSYKEGTKADKYPARRFPIQHEIRQLEDELNSFNERIAELEDESGSCDGSVEGKCNRLCATDR